LIIKGKTVVKLYHNVNLSKYSNLSPLVIDRWKTFFFIFSPKITPWCIFLKINATKRRKINMNYFISFESSANIFEAIFKDAVEEITSRLKLFSNEDLSFTVSEDIDKPGSFNIVAPVETESLGWMNYVAKKVNFCISADVTSHKDELIFIPSLQFCRTTGEVVILNIADFGCTTIELVYDKRRMEFTFYSTNHILFRNLRDISSYVSHLMNNSGLSNDIKMFINKYQLKRDYQEDDKQIIVKTLEDITDLIDTQFSNGNLTVKEKSIQKLSNQLKDIMFDIKNSLK